MFEASNVVLSGDRSIAEVLCYGRNDVVRRFCEQRLGQYDASNQYWSWFLTKQERHVEMPCAEVAIPFLAPQQPRALLLRLALTRV